MDECSEEEIEDEVLGWETVREGFPEGAVQDRAALGRKEVNQDVQGNEDNWKRVGWLPRSLFVLLAMNRN